METYIEDSLDVLLKYAMVNSLSCDERTSVGHNVDAGDVSLDNRLEEGRPLEFDEKVLLPSIE